jgi:hypothetical protein
MSVTVVILSPSCPVFVYSAVVDTHHSSCRTFSDTRPVLRPASFGTPSLDADGGCHRQCVPYNQRLLPGEPSMPKKQFYSSFFISSQCGRVHVQTMRYDYTTKPAFEGSLIGKLRIQTSKEKWGKKGQKREPRINKKSHAE